MPTPPPSDPDRPAEDARIWSLLLHEHAAFLQYGNHFLVAESMLAVAYSLLLSGDVALAARVICVLGLITAAAWAYVTRYTALHFRQIRDLAWRRFPEYDRILAAAPRKPVGVLDVFSLVMPGLVGVTWVVLFIVP